MRSYKTQAEEFEMALTMLVAEAIRFRDSPLSRRFLDIAIQDAINIIRKYQDMALEEETCDE